MNKKKEEKNIHLFEGWTFSKKNYVLGGIGLATIIFGYIIMATGTVDISIFGYIIIPKGTVNNFRSLTLAPIMLFIGYLIIIPIALLYRVKKKQ